MKGRSLIKIALSIILTFVLTLVMVAFPVNIASANQNRISQESPNFDKNNENKCSQQTFDVLEQFIEDMGITAEAYVTLAGIYLDCQQYTLAKKLSKQAIAINRAEPDSLVVLVAQNYLVEIEYGLGNISIKQRDELTKRINETINAQFPSSRGQCYHVCPNGLLGRMIYHWCFNC